MTRYAHGERPLRIHTALGEDVLLLARFDGEEAISQPFRFALELASPRMDIDAADLLRTPAVVSFPLHDGSVRTIHGIFSRFAQTGRHEDLATYRAEIVAWPWFLSLRRNSRIFQDKTILEIAEALFEEWGISDFEFRCDAPAAREYVVQYNESDLDFLSRWLETEGIFYWFEHSDEGHVLVLADGNGAIEPCPDISEGWIRGREVIDQDVVESVTREHAVQVGRVVLRDYDYLQPSFTLESVVEGDGTYEVYDYPGQYLSRSEGERYARLRLEAEEARRDEIRGAGNCRWMTSGHSFELHGHFNDDTNGEYILTAVRHTCAAGGFRAGEADEIEYRNSFQCIPSDVPFRPQRTTPRPVVRGSQTAVIVGPDGEEVWMDRYGRVKVQFHWDREGQHDENSSCWMRVATPWGGKGYGSISVPRIGNEVLIDFLEGDPDQPIIVGSVYNAEQMPPFDLPAGGIQMGMKSRSSPGGGGHNEITMTDTQGSEQLTIHAQYDQSITVGNDETHQVGVNRTSSVGVDESLSVGANQDVSIGADQKTTIGANRETSVGADDELSVGANRTAGVGADDALDVGGSIAVGAGANVTVDAGGNVVISAGGKISLSAPTIEILGDGKVVISVGGTSMELTPGSLTTSSPAITTTASASHDIKGAVVKHNC